MNNLREEKIPFTFFGTPDFAVHVLEELEQSGHVPRLVVTAPDRRAGRGMKLTPPPVKMWAQERGVPVFQPERLDDEAKKRIADAHADVSVVAAYGLLIPRAILDIPPKGALNIHPSLLPKYRGSSPIEAAILSGDDKTGVTVIRMDEKMDHGPILAQKEFPLSGNEMKQSLGEALFREGAHMVADVLERMARGGDIPSVEQRHGRATYTERIRKEDGRISLADDGEMNWRKFRAYEGWPGVYFFSPDGSRVKITGAKYKDGKFIITRVIPEGKKETVAVEKYL